MDAKIALPSLPPPLDVLLFTAPTKELAPPLVTSTLPWLLLMPTLDVSLESPHAKPIPPLELPLTALPSLSPSLLLSFWLLLPFSSKFLI